MSILSNGYYSLRARINKVGNDTGEEEQEGVASSLTPELEVDLDEDELIKLANQWKKNWDKKIDSLPDLRRENEHYWLGIQSDYQGGRSGHGHHENRDNVLFEAVETFIPLATSANPEPLVVADNTVEGEELADTVRKQLTYIADTSRLKLDLKRAVRFWLLYYVGVAKISWDFPSDEIKTDVIRPQQLILDPEASVESAEYTGQYIGHVRKDTAETLVKRFPKKKEEIKKLVKDKMMTELRYTEWWTTDVLFWKVNDIILDIKRNPHWNYNSTREEVTTDEFGVETTEEVEERGRNHFSERKMPFVFLSVFNVGKHPYDQTSLVEQVISIQDSINLRRRQIDANASQMNTSIIADADVVTKEQLAQAARALAVGLPIRVSGGERSVGRNNVPPLPSFVFDALIDDRTQLRNIFGVSGSSPQGVRGERTVRGKIQIQGQDADRIGSGIGEYVEEFADGIYNWWVQMMFVYYNEEHHAAVVGKDSAMEFTSLRRDDFNKKLLVSVKPGSLVPKDDLTKRNEAIDLWAAGAIDPVTLFDKIGYADPNDAAKRLFQWQSNPASLFPQEAQQAEAQAPQEVPVEGALPPLPPIQEALNQQIQ